MRFIIHPLIVFALLYIMARSFFIWRDTRSVTLFGKSINVHKGLRIEKEMLGPRRQPFGIFSLALGVSLLMLYVGGFTYAPWISKIAFCIMGISAITYGLYGIVKREIISFPTDYGTFGYCAVITGLVYMAAGLGLIVLTVYGSFIR